MRIGLDYGGVISFAPDGWAETVKKAMSKGHEVFIVSHVQPGEVNQLKLRSDFVNKTGVTNLTFSDLEWPNDKNAVGQRKADLCNQYNIEIFIDDDLFLAQEVGRICDRCASLYVPINLWQVGQRLIDGLDKDG